MVNVLYVDDEEDLLELAKYYLKDSDNISLITASNALTGLELIQSGKIDVVVSDYSMPSMDGLAFLKALRGSGSDLPFILFTGKGREEVVIQALNEGADFYLQKGGNPRPQFIELVHKIKHSHEQRISRRALKSSENRLKRAEEKAHFGHWEMQIDDAMIQASHGARQIYGLEGERWPYKLIKEYPFPEYRAKLDRAMKGLIENNIYFDEVFKICRKSDGAIIDVHSQAEYDPEKRIVFGVIQDITGLMEVQEELVRKNEELNSSYEQISMSEEELRQILDELTKQQIKVNESELRFRKIFETIPIGLWLADAKGMLLAGNPAGQKIWEAEPHVGQENYGIFKAWHLPNMEPLGADDWALGHAVNEGKTTEYEMLEIKAFNGKHKHILNWAAPLKNENGEIIGAFVINQDISESTQTMKALKESEEKYRMLVRYSSDPIFNFNPDETYGFVNEAFARPFGKTPEEIIGKTPHSLFPYEEAERRLKLVRKVFNTGERGEIEVKIQTKTGDTRYYVTIVDPIKDENGKILQVSCMSKDITDRKMMEEALRRSEDMHRSVLENAGIGFAFWDLDGNMLLMNTLAAKNMGGVPEDFIGRNMLDLFGNEGGNIYKERILRASKSEVPIEFEDHLNLPIGESWFISVFSRTIDAVGNITGVQIFSHDIRERKFSEMALHAANKKLHLLGSISRHDTLNHMTVLKGYLDVLEETELTPAQQNMLTHVKRSANAIEHISRFTKQYQEIGLSSPNWQKVSKCIDSTRDTLASNGIEVRNEVGDLQLLADPMFEKVIQNLIDNSVRHSGGANLISFSFEESDGTGRLVFEDNGRGITDDERAILFQPGKGKNTGFGLFLSKEILEITGMNLEEMGGNGSGARFVITIPRNQYRLT